MKGKFKKPLAIFLLSFSVLLGSIGVAYAQTVYFRGCAVNWEHGRKNGIISYSRVFTHLFEHSATANETWSGWKSPGLIASAEQVVGVFPAKAYWDCR